jgi:hypothetical protein
MRSTRKTEIVKSTTTTPNETTNATATIAGSRVVIRARSAASRSATRSIRCDIINETFVGVST